MSVTTDAVPQAAARVTLLTRAQCHLCGPVRRTIGEVCAETGDGWTEVDIDADPELRAEYSDQIPVVLVDGVQVASHRLAADDLRAALAAR